MATYRELHPWNLTPSEAVALQKTLASQVKIVPLAREITTVAGCDISFDKGSDKVWAGVVVLSLPDLQVIESAGVETKAPFPYVPGLLSFRETPPLLEAWAKLKTEPDAVVMDGQGLAHPRRMGLACHFGLVVERPTLGCAKTVLVGKFDAPEPAKGSWSPMVYRNETVGAALRAKDKVTPVYISPGHEIDLKDSVALTLRCAGGYRVPEPTRQAHLYVNRLRRGELE